MCIRDRRSAGRSAVAAAAYRSGTKLTNEWDGMTHDYTRKGGIVHAEIMPVSYTHLDVYKRQKENYNVLCGGAKWTI